MKKANKKLQVLLIIIVGVIWASVFLRVKKLQSNKLGLTINYNYNDSEINKKSILKDTLYLNYKDPFLKYSRNNYSKVKDVIKIQQKQIEQNISKKIEQKKEESAAKHKLIKNTNYYGCVSGKKNVELIGFLQCNEKLFVLKCGDQVNEMKVISISPDYITIKYYNKTYSIKKYDGNKSIISLKNKSV